ncbi:LacI family DNA-binding transcriptional regulator [Pacificibacter marinus]|uniref:LacI family DNA-binding transcriptional regulator n=1 Tax=Pacificibacter marinus TaxID=658057 RepID=UPI001C07EB5B|nr:LacI family DNA-binding transcriptional regulator [Pacificibacter marinus]MBU2868417.1 LacI family transcriptional regulator [Pacificibacter marinus]
MKRRVTLAEVAKSAGVSHQTVSNVLNNRSVVREETRKLVSHHLKQSGYRRNATARSLKTNQSNLIGLVVPSMTNSMYAEVAQAVVREAERRGYTVMMAVSNRDAEVEMSVVHTIIDHNAAGILISPSDVEGKASKLIKDQGVPFAEMLNRSAFDMCDVYEADNHNGARTATNHLIECGHTNIGFIAGVFSSTAQSRYEGYIEALKTAGLPMSSELIVSGNYTREGGLLACQQILDSGRHPTAIFCASDIMAYGAMDELAARGLRIPQDVAIIGFDDMELSSLPGVSLSSISFQPAVLACRAIAQLIDRIELSDPFADRAYERVPCSLVVRASTVTTQTHRDAS